MIVLVHLKDEGVFDAPIDKIWRFLQDDNANHEHRAVKFSKVLERSGKVMVVEMDGVSPDGKAFKQTAKFTFNPPKGGCPHPITVPSSFTARDKSKPTEMATT